MLISDAGGSERARLMPAPADAFAEAHADVLRDKRQVGRGTSFLLLPHLPSSFPLLLPSPSTSFPSPSPSTLLPEGTGIQRTGRSTHIQAAQAQASLPPSAFFSQAGSATTQPTQTLNQSFSLSLSSSFFLHTSPPPFFTSLHSCQSHLVIVIITVTVTRSTDVITVAGHEHRHASHNTVSSSSFLFFPALPSFPHILASSPTMPPHVTIATPIRRHTLIPSYLPSSLCV